MDWPELRASDEALNDKAVFYWATQSYQTMLIVQWVCARTIAIIGNKNWNPPQWNLIPAFLPTRQYHVSLRHLPPNASDFIRATLTKTHSNKHGRARVSWNGGKLFSKPPWHKSSWCFSINTHTFTLMQLFQWTAGAGGCAGPVRFPTLTESFTDTQILKRETIFYFLQRAQSWNPSRVGERSMDDIWSTIHVCW